MNNTFRPSGIATEYLKNEECCKARRSSASLTRWKHKSFANRNRASSRHSLLRSTPQFTPLFLTSLSLLVTAVEAFYRGSLHKHSSSRSKPLVLFLLIPRAPTYCPHISLLPLISFHLPLRQSLESRVMVESSVLIRAVQIPVPLLLVFKLGGGEH